MYIAHTDTFTHLNKEVSYIKSIAILQLEDKTITYRTEHY